MSNPYVPKRFQPVMASEPQFGQNPTFPQAKDPSSARFLNFAERLKTVVHRFDMPANRGLPAPFSRLSLSTDARPAQGVDLYQGRRLRVCLVCARISR